MRLKKGYLRWKDLEKKWMNDTEFVHEWEKVEPEYQLARSLIGARIKKKLTQMELANKIGSKQPVVSRIESMASTPSVSLLKRLAEALDVKLRIQFVSK